VTEQEWLACNDPVPMLEFLRRKASARKLRLLACACCRQVWDRLEQEGSRHAVEVAESFADSLASYKRLQLARNISTESKDPIPFGGAIACAWYATAKSARDAAEGAARTSQVANSPDWDAACRKADRTRSRADREAVGLVGKRETKLAKKAQVGLVLDLFGNPFRPITLDPTWRTPAVVQLARSLYEERRFEDMPVLADALEEAGCQDAAVLGHCRSPGPHVRECWAVDLMLGRS
jgi:hypothetical protein